MLFLRESLQYFWFSCYFRLLFMYFPFKNCTPFSLKRIEGQNFLFCFSSRLLDSDYFVRETENSIERLKEKMFFSTRNCLFVLAMIVFFSFLCSSLQRLFTETASQTARQTHTEMGITGKWGKEDCTSILQLDDSETFLLVNQVCVCSVLWVCRVVISHQEIPCQ